jgi:arylformamidase
MSFRDYYVQEPLSEAAQSYHTEVMRRGAALSGEEMRYGADPYQSVVIFRAPEPNTPILAFLHGGGWTNGFVYGAGTDGSRGYIRQCRLPVGA